MKNLIALSLTILSLSSSATLLEEAFNSSSILTAPCDTGQRFDCVISTTTSLPTLLIGDEVEMESEELSNYIYSELGEDETPILNLISDRLELEIEDIVLTVMALDEAGIPVTMINIKEMASQLQ